MPAYATTFYKAQGMSTDRVCLWHAPTHGDTLMLYVGLSRVRRLDGLFLREPLTTADVRRAVPALHLFDELDRLDALQVPQLRTDAHVLAARRVRAERRGRGRREEEEAQTAALGCCRAATSQ